MAAMISASTAKPSPRFDAAALVEFAAALLSRSGLSQEPARAVAEVLVDRFAVDPARVAAKGVGFLAPRASNQTDEGRQKNRRVEVISTSTKLLAP